MRLIFDILNGIFIATMLAACVAYYLVKQEDKKHSGAK